MAGRVAQMFARDQIVRDLPGERSYHKENQDACRNGKGAPAFTALVLFLKHAARTEDDPSRTIGHLALAIGIMAAESIEEIGGRFG